MTNDMVKTCYCCGEELHNGKTSMICLKCLNAAFGDNLALKSKADNETGTGSGPD